MRWWWWWGGVVVAPLPTAEEVKMALTCEEDVVAPAVSVTTANQSSPSPEL